MSYIEINNLWKEYGDNVVLEGVNLNVNEGEFVSVVGASGCGKTTFLKMLLGEESPSRGEILLDGEPLKDEPDQDRGIVFQRYSVFPHLTVIQNVVLGLELQGNKMLGKLFGTPKRNAMQRAMQAIEQVGLLASKDKYPSELSGGMQQRLAIAQSLITRPRILLLDEPFGALDPGIRADMHELILKLWQEFGLTIFMITHDIKEGFHLGSRLLVFDKIRHDEQAPDAYGARTTYDLPLEAQVSETIDEITESISPEKSTREDAMTNASTTDEANESKSIA